jgi:tryptophan-rich sensory protein
MPTTLAPHTRSTANRVRNAIADRPRIRPRISSRVTRRDAASLAAFALATAAAAGVGTYFGSAKGPARAWYRRLRGPELPRPPKAFAPLRTALYALVALSGWRVWRAAPSDRAARKRALALWATQLGLDAAWPPLLFRRRSARAALADVAALFGTAGAYTSTARRIDRPAAWLMAPYLGWVGLAAYRNAGTVRR